jgi:hypothetical protein
VLTNVSISWFSSSMHACPGQRSKIKYRFFLYLCGQQCHVTELNQFA